MRAPGRRQRICAAPRWCAVAGRRSSSWPGAVRSRAGRRRPGPAGSRCSGAGRRRCRRAWYPGWPLADCLQALLCLQLRDTHQPTFTAVPKADIYILPSADAAAKMPCAGSLCAFWWWFPKGMAPAIARPSCGRGKRDSDSGLLRRVVNRQELRCGWPRLAGRRRLFLGKSSPPPLRPPFTLLRVTSM